MTRCNYTDVVNWFDKWYVKNIEARFDIFLNTYKGTGNYGRFQFKMRNLQLKEVELK